MMSPVLLLAAMCMASLCIHGSAFSTATGTFTSRSSLLAGKANYAREPTRQHRRTWMEMRVFAKRGRSRVPPRVRHDYSHEHTIREERNEKAEAGKYEGDGLPVFNLFVREHRRNTWYPFASFKGNEQSASMVASYRDGDEDASHHKDELDWMVSMALMEDFPTLYPDLFAQYPQLRKHGDEELEFGYRIAFENLSSLQKAHMSVISHTQLMP